MDSWADLGSVTDKFLLGCDWQSQPTKGVEPFRTVIQAPGTGIKLRNITDDVQHVFSMHFSNMSKTDENDLLSFFAARRGRASAFWLPIPESYWKLNVDTDLATPNFLVLDNSDPQYLQGYERLFMLLRSGDYLCRQVFSVTTPGGPGLPNLMTVVTALDRVIKKNDPELFGRMILCRFDQDEIELQHDTPDLSETDIAFRELPKEYAGL